MAQLPGDFLIYNGVKLQIVKCERFDQETVMSGDNVDYLYTKIHAVYQCLFNYGIDSALPPDYNAAVRPLLNAPRGQLIFGFSFDNQFSVNIVSNLVVSPPNGTLVDLNNGPIPGRVTIHRIDGAQTFHVRFEITTCIREDGCESNAVLSSRYSQMHSYDKDFYTTIRTTGITYFNTLFLADSNIVMDYFRRFIFPAIPYNCKRTIDSVRVDSSKNIMEWTITDVEQGKNIGETGSSGSGTFISDIQASYHVETAYAPGQSPGITAGLCALEVVDVNVTGSRLASSWVLIQYALGLALNQIPTIGIPFAAGGSVTRSISVTKDLIKNSIELRIAALKPPVGNITIPAIANDAGLQIDNIFSTFQQDDGRNPSPPIDGGSRGTSNYLALEAGLSLLCDTSPQPVLCNGGLESGYYDGCQQAIPVQPFTFLPQTTNMITPAQTQAPYVYYENRTKYKSTPGTKNVPVAGPPNNGNYSMDDPRFKKSEIIQPKQSQIQREDNGKAGRIGAPPLPPAPTAPLRPWFPFPVPAVPPVQNMPTTPVWIPTDYELIADNVELLPDGETLFYSIEWKFTSTAILDPSQDPGLIAFSVPPWINFPLGGQDSDGNNMGYTTDDLNSGTGIIS